MAQFLLFVLLGLGLGSLIAGLGLGVVLSYRGGGVINLAVGGIAMLGAFVFYDLRTSGALLLPPIPFARARLDLGGPWPALPRASTPSMFSARKLAELPGVSAQPSRSMSTVKPELASCSLTLAFVTSTAGVRDDSPAGGSDGGLPFALSFATTPETLSSGPPRRTSKVAPSITTVPLRNSAVAKGTCTAASSASGGAACAPPPPIRMDRKEIPVSPARARPIVTSTPSRSRSKAAARRAAIAPPIEG